MMEVSPLDVFEDMTDLHNACHIIEQRNAFLREFIFYVDSVGKEQRLKESGIVPPLEDYIGIRTGSCAVGQVFACTEYNAHLCPL